MTSAAQILSKARETPSELPEIVDVLASNKHWRGVFDHIDKVVAEQLDDIVARDDVEQAARLAGTNAQGEPADPAESARRGHALGQLSEACVEAVTFDWLYQRPTAELSPLWRTLCEASAAADSARLVTELLDGASPMGDLDDIEAACASADAELRPLDDARFDEPFATMWEPVEYVIISIVDANLEARFEHPVEY